MGGDSTETAAATSTTAPAESVVEETSTTEAGTDPPPTASAETEPAAYVAQVLGPSVVQIETDFGIGSGVVYDTGMIITNHHVVADATYLRVLLNDGSSLDGRLLGSSTDVDIAVVAVDEGGDLPVANLALGEKPTVGQTAIAIGSPFRLQQSVTEGIVSAVDRPVPSGNSIVAMIQTDAPINPGNSGGALADREGRVVGINTAIQTGGSTNTNAGVGFAIPIDTAVGVANKIVAGEPIEPGFLGVAGGPTEDNSAGVQVEEVTAGSAAEAAGIQVGDHILSIDGAPVTAFQDLIGLIVAHSPGDTIDIELVRDGEPVTVTATLGRKEE
jgi:S1-C subfamily serine protease